MWIITAPESSPSAPASEDSIALIDRARCAGGTWSSEGEQLMRWPKRFKLHEAAAPKPTTPETMRGVPPQLDFTAKPKVDSYDLRPVVSFSGGRTSAFMASVLLDVFHGEVDFIFMDTGAEHPKTYEFIQRCDQHFGLNLVCLRGRFNQPLGKSHTYEVVSSSDIGPDNGPFAEMMSKYGTPTVNSAWCTSRMKEETHGKYCNDTYGKDAYATWIGIRADEPKRLKRMGRDPRLRFLAEVSDAGKPDILEWWSNQPFDLEIPEHLGNCVFCIKKSIAKLARATNEEPELMRMFTACIADANPRPDLSRPYPKEVMFRGKNTLESLQELGQVANPEYLDQMTKGSHACEESCEIVDLEVDED